MRAFRAGAAVAVVTALVVFLPAAAETLEAGPGLTSRDRSWRDRPAVPFASGDSVVWRPLPALASDSIETLWRPPASVGGKPLWRAAGAGDPRRDFQLHRLAALGLAAGDTAVAESCWTALAARVGPWRWEGLRGLTERAVRRGDTLAARAAYARTPRDLGRAETTEWLLWGARLDSISRDSARTAASARRAFRFSPALPAARSALDLFDRMTAPRGDTLDLEAQRDAAEVDALIGRRAAAIQRLRRVFPSRAGAAGLRVGLRLAELQRSSGRLADALATLDSTARLASSADALAELLLGRARVHRDAGRADSAYALYARAATGASRAEITDVAWWELAREAEQRREWARARDAYGWAERAHGRSAKDAAVRQGLLWLVEGYPGRARSCFARGEGEGARFWWAIAARDSSRAGADSALALIAGEPGYTFYRACARDSLGLGGRPAGAAAAADGGDGGAAPDLMRELIGAGLAGEAAALIARWEGGDPATRIPGVSPGSGAVAMARLATYAYACGLPRTAIRIAGRALDADTLRSDSSRGARWALGRLLYPPLFRATVDSVTRDPRAGIEPALLQALVWKESHFDSAALSRSGAVGLTQLMPATAAEAARRLRERAPPESALTRPRINLRFGALYLRRLLDRFGGSVPLALAAYNAGPRTADESALAGLPGDALQCELVAYAETQDYVKTILAVRRAYRELRPGARP